jgi:hypothetical protein
LGISRLFVLWMLSEGLIVGDCVWNIRFYYILDVFSWFLSTVMDRELAGSFGLDY